MRKSQKTQLKQNLLLFIAIALSLIAMRFSVEVIDKIFFLCVLLCACCLVCNE